MKEGWNSHLWSEIDGNCIFADGLGAIWNTFNQTSQGQEAKVDLRGHFKLHIWGWYGVRIEIFNQLQFDIFMLKGSGTQQPQIAFLWNRKYPPGVAKHAHPDGMAPRLDLISFWQSGHVTSEVNFGLWPHVGGLTEYLSNSSQTIRKYTIPVNFWPQVAVPAFFHYFTIITVSGLWLLIETFFFWIFGQG